MFCESWRIGAWSRFDNDVLCYLFVPQKCSDIVELRQGCMPMDIL